MQAWKQNDHTDFDFNNAHELTTIRSWSTEDSIKRSLRERISNTKIFIVLVGNQTKYHHKFVMWEIEQALKLGLPIIVVNLNGKRSKDESLCPVILRDELAVHVSFNARIIQHALENWEDFHYKFKREGRISSYYYNENVYSGLGL